MERTIESALNGGIKIVETRYSGNTIGYEVRVGCYRVECKHEKEAKELFDGILNLVEQVDGKTMLLRCPCERI